MECDCDLGEDGSCCGGSCWVDREASPLAGVELEGEIFFEKDMLLDKMVIRHPQGQASKAPSAASGHRSMSGRCNSFDGSTFFPGKPVT